MFDNTFNRNRKDPLVDSIKSIMEDTNMRNQAEGLVCEAFGILNKNALANEEVTPFALACEEIYKQLKEGVQIDELYGKGRLKDIKQARSKDTYKAWKKAEKASDVEHDERGYRTGPSREDKEYGKAKHREEKADMVAQKLKHHRKKMGFNEELAKKDYDKDGKIESPKDEVWGSRLRAAKMAGKMEEEQIDEISKELRGRYVAKARKDMEGHRAKASLFAKGTPEKKAEHDKKADKRASGILKATFKEELAKKDYDKDGKIESPKDEVWGSRLRAARMAGKMEEEQIDELYGKGKLKDIIDARQKKENQAKKNYAAAERKMFAARSETGKAENVKEKLRLRNISKPGDPHYDWAHSKRKLREEEQIDEVGNTEKGRSVLKSYIKKAGGTHRDGGVMQQALAHDAKPGGELAKNAARKSGNRAIGVERAVDRLEEAFEEIYIALNEKALFALENNQFENFINNLTDEEFDFLDEEIVNEIVVQKSQMKAGETLGMAMNRLTGKTAVKNGANDPTGSGFKGDRAASAKLSPTINVGGSKTDTRPVTTKNSAAYKSAQDSDSTTDPGAIENAKRAATSAAQNSTLAKAPPTKQDALAADAAAQKTSKPVTSPVSGPGGTQTKPMSAASSSMDTADSGDAAKGADTGGGAKAPSAGGQPGDSASANVKKLLQQNESYDPSKKGFVTVGNMRIKLL